MDALIALPVATSLIMLKTWFYPLAKQDGGWVQTQALQDTSLEAIALTTLQRLLFPKSEFPEVVAEKLDLRTVFLRKLQPCSALAESSSYDP